MSGIIPAIGCLLELGDKVVVKSKSRRQKRFADGHICTIRSLNHFDGSYELDWCSQDNPGRERPHCVDMYYYYDCDIAPLSSLYPVVVEKKSLPDV